MNLNTKRTGLILLSAILILALCAGCSGVSTTTENAVAAPAYYPEMATEITIGGDMAVSEAAAAMDVAPVEFEASPSTGGGEDGGLGGSGLVVQQSDGDRKIVINVDLGLQTKNFDSGVQDIAALTAEMGGYIQDSYVSGSGIDEKYISRSASYTARIPTDRLNAFLEAVTGSFHVVHQQQSSTDISMNYYDTEARLTSLRVQEARLLAMLRESGDLEYMLKVEREYADVLFEIEQYTSSLNRMDDSVNLSTVTMQLNEVVEYEDVVAKPATFGERVSETFGESLENFTGFCEGLLLFFIMLLPFLPVIAVLVIVAVLLLRRSNKRAAARRAAYYPQTYPAPQPPVENTTKAEEDSGKE